MASSADQYTREIHDKLHYWAAWLPGTLIRLGDCGTVDRFVFNRRSSLSSFGIAFDKDKRGSSGHLTHQSAKGVSVTFHAAGASQQVPGLDGQAGASIEFKRNNAVVFAARDCVQAAIVDLDRLARDLKHAYFERGFPAHYVVVTSVVRAAAATVLVSQSRRGLATLRAAGHVGLDGLADLANADAQLSVVRSRDLATQYVAESDLTPLFRVMGFKTHWYNGMPGDELETMGGDALLPNADLDLMPADFNDYAEYAEAFSS